MNDMGFTSMKAVFIAFALCILFIFKSILDYKQKRRVLFVADIPITLFCGVFAIVKIFETINM